MRNVELKRLVILIFLILLLTATFLIDSSNTKIYLSKQSIIKPNFFAIYNSSSYGSSVFLGKLLHDFYSHRTTFVFPTEITKKQFYKKYRFRPQVISFYSYPIKVRFDDFNCFLEKEEFDLLIRRKEYSLKTSRLTYYLIRKDCSELGLFIYEDNVVVAPMRWGNNEGK